jgi:hypothetical protein
MLFFESLTSIEDFPGSERILQTTEERIKMTLEYNLFIITHSLSTRHPFAAHP